MYLESSTRSRRYLELVRNSYVIETKETKKPGKFMLELFVIVTPFVLLFAFLFHTLESNKKRRKQELGEWMGERGFEVLSKVNQEDLELLQQHNLPFGMLLKLQAVCIAETDSIRTVVIEYYVNKQYYEQLLLGSQKRVSAPRMLIKKRTAATRSILTACWEDVLFQIRFEEDPEFDKSFIVRGDSNDVRTFLNSRRRRALCESSQVPTEFSVCLNSVLIKYSAIIEQETFEHNLGQSLAMLKIMSREYDQENS